MLARLDAATPRWQAVLKDHSVAIAYGAGSEIEHALAITLGELETPESANEDAPQGSGAR